MPEPVSFIARMPGRAVSSVICLATGLLLTALSTSGWSQPQTQPRTVTLTAAQAREPRIDEAYTAKIREFTTEPFFLTPYIDHLPASSEVPTPMQFLGRAIGTPDHLHYPHEIHAYLRAVAEASDRVQVFVIGESEEGREMILAVVAEAEDLRNLDRYKDHLAALGDPRRTSEAEMERLLGVAKPIYWATGAIHSPETGSPEMLMELVYRLAVGESPFIRQIRENLIVMVTPVVEVDGRAKQIDLHLARHRDPDSSLPARPLWWGPYVAHSANRDGMALSLNLTRNIMRTFLEYQPTVLHDLHESASYLYTSTGRGPYNAWVDPVLINEWNRLAYREVTELTALGVPGVYTYDFYDGWTPNYMFWIANQRNSIGRFYETQAARDGSTHILSTRVDRQWHRPNTPLPQVVWSLRNNVNLQQSGLLIAMHEVAVNREEFLRNYYLKSQRSIAKATAEGPAAWVFPADDPRPGQQARLLQLLQRHGIEVHRTTREASVEGTSLPSGSYVVRMDQPYSRAADMMLDRQYYSPADPAPYDDVGWSKGALYNARTLRIEDPAILRAEMTEVAEPVQPAGGVSVVGRGDPVIYAINYNADNNLASFRFHHPSLQIEAARDSFTLEGRTFNPGSFLIRTRGNPGNLRSMLESAGGRYGFTAFGFRAAPEVATHQVAVPRVAVMHTWLITQNEGWLRIGLDEYQIPYDYISVHTARDTPRLRDHWDVIIMGPSVDDPFRLLRGLTGNQPIPWKATDETPNIGRQAETDDMRGGLELQGLLHLARFIEEGGTFITLANSSVLPIHFGLAEGISIQDAGDLWAPGGVYRARIEERASPLVYGYGDELAVYFNRGPLLRDGRTRALTARIDPDPGSTTARRSSRGGINEQDIVQGRSRDLGQAGVEEFLRARREEAQAQERVMPPGFMIPTGARTVMRFPADPRELLISGGLSNGVRMAGTPALVDAPYGQGHVVVFSFNPFWRSGTLGSYALLFNALLHHGNLDAGQSAPGAGVDPG